VGPGWARRAGRDSVQKVQVRRTGETGRWGVQVLHGLVSFSDFDEGETSGCHLFG